MSFKILPVFLSLFIVYSGIVSAQPALVYFTKSVDNSASTITNAVTAKNMEDTICAYIRRAKSTLDIAMWDNGSDKIVGALNEIFSKGVTVRYITSSNSSNSALDKLNAGIPVLERNAFINNNVMHNKFLNIDKSFIITGSMNANKGSMFDDYNNIIIFNDKSLAENYLIEFNEMWGSSGTQPSTANSKFGPDKTNNTKHEFIISGSKVELYFSPTDGTTAKIIDAINRADYTIDFAVFTFINNDLGDAVIKAKERGVVVRGIIENINYIGSEYSKLRDKGINVLSHNNTSYDFHHKYCIIDAEYPDSDPVLVTGSHNWTNSAEEEYDENTLIVHNSIIANQYFEEFSRRFAELSPSGAHERPEPEIKITPVSSGLIRINSTLELKQALVNIFNQQGILVYQNSELNGTVFEFDISRHPQGMYFIEFNIAGKKRSFKHMKL